MTTNSTEICRGEEVGILKTLLNACSLIINILTCFAKHSGYTVESYYTLIMRYHYGKSEKSESWGLRRPTGFIVKVTDIYV